MTPESWFAFAAIWVVACLGVGPNSLTCVSDGASDGFLHGLWSALGITTASFFHALIAAFGFSAILLAYAEAYTVLKWLGVGYLIYRGLRFWWRRPQVLSIGRGALESRLVLFRRAFQVSITNPQPILTYLAIFTPAIDPRLALAPQLAVLIPTAVGIVWVIFSLYVLSGTPLRFIVSSVRRQLILDRITGAFYVGTAALVASTDAKR